MIMVTMLENTVISASVFTLIALSFSLIYSTTRFFHFAHGAVYVIGAYSAFSVISLFRARLADSIGVPWWAHIIAIVIAIIIAALAGALMEVCIYRPLRRRGASATVLLIASMGLYIVLQNVISAFYGDDTKTIRTWPVREGLNILGARITPVQLIIIAAAIVLFTATIIILRRTRAGIAMRALAANPDLARACGMDADRVILLTFITGSALCGAAGVLISLDIDMTPTMGMNALLMGVVAAVAGGIGSLPGAAIGALILAFAQHFGVWKLPSQWQDAIAFGVLLIFLIFRPQGVLGRRIQRVSV